MENKENIINEAQLFRYYNNEMDTEEAAYVKSWILDSSKNEKFALDYYHIFLASEAIIDRKTTEEALHAVKMRVKKKRNKVSIGIWIQRISAILLIPALLSIWYISTKEYPLTYIETQMSPGMTGHIQLSDGSEIWLNSNSKIKYPTTFSSNERRVILSGEAYFSVKKDSKRKFIVEADNTSIEVLGTQFNIDAYENADRITTTLVSGSIRMLCPDKQGNNNITLMSPNQQLTYDRKSRTTQIQTISSRKDTSWKDGQIILRDTPLEDVLWMLSKRFNVDFEIKDKKLNNSSFTGTFDNQSLERVLEYFKISSNINYKIKYTTKEENNKERTKIELY